MESAARAFPEVVYANDGTKYYPCKYCCRAFAHKRYLTLHMRACLKKLDASSPVDATKFVDKLTAANRGKVKKEMIVDLTDEAKQQQQRRRRGGNDDNGRSSSRRMKLNNRVPQNNKKRATTEKCKICSLAFESMEELIMHAKIEHNQKKNSEKRIFPPAELEYFYTIFLKSNRTTCPICDKPIGNKLNWKRHLYTHSSVKKYECLVCKKTFSRSDHCKYHQKRHKVKVEVFLPEEEEDA